MCGSSLHSWGTHCVNRLMMWWPSGASDGSSTVGTTPSLNGAVAGRPARASSNARSRYATECASSTPPDRSVSSGMDGKLGRRSSAQLIFTTPLRVFQFWMSSTNSAGSSDASSCCRNVIFGWIAVTIHGARTSSPLSRTTPVARPSLVRIRATRAFVRTSQPRDSALRRIASATAPIPPSGTAHEPRWPSPTSPIEWCAIT